MKLVEVNFRTEEASCFLCGVGALREVVMTPQMASPNPTVFRTVVVCNEHAEGFLRRFDGQ